MKAGARRASVRYSWLIAQKMPDRRVAGRCKGDAERKARRFQIQHRYSSSIAEERR
jgi:hypothetical protein